MVKITCRRSSDSTSCEVSIDNDVDNVQDLVERTRKAMGIASDQYIRLITRGKLMKPDTKLSYYNLQQSGGFVHVVVTDREVNSRPRHVDEALESLPRGGLSELAHSHGLEVNQVVALRLTFSEEIEFFRRSQNLEMRPGESESQFAARVETQWILSQRSNSEFWRNLPAVNRAIDDAMHAQMASARRRERLMPSPPDSRRNGYRFDEDDEDNEDNEDNEDDEDDENDGFGQRGGGQSSSFLSHFASLLGSQQRYSPVREQELASVHEEMPHNRTRRARREGSGETEDSGHDLNEELVEGGRGAQPPLTVATGGMRMDRGPIPAEDQMGTAKDCCWGFMLGTAFGTLMLLCIFDRNMNHRNKMGILVGISLQLMFSIANNRIMTDSNGDSGADGR